MKRVAVYGGSFDPPHVAHVLVASYVSAVCDVDEIWVFPVFKHPFEKKLADFDTRLRLCRKAFEQLLNVYVYPYEEDVGTGFTLDLLKYLTKRHPENQYSLILGSDLIPTLPKWKGFMDETCKIARPILVAREGYTVAMGSHAGGYPQIPQAVELPFKLPCVSSTRIREKLVAGKDVSDVVPRKVLDVINELGLYRTKAV